LVKHIGFSFHGTTPYLEKLLKEHPEMEFVMLQLNYMDILRGPAGDWLNLARKYNKPIIAMEPVKGGSLAALPAPAEALLKAQAPDRSIASWAIQYAASLPDVICVLSGMSTIGQVEDNLRTFDGMKPLSEAEHKLLDDVLNEMSKVANIPCTACKYCLESCPQEIVIDTCFSIYNELKRGASRWNRTMLYRNLPAGRKAADCTGCGLCLDMCPQHLDIPKDLATVAEEMARP